MATTVWLRRARWRPTVLNTCVTSLGVHMNRSNRCLKHGKRFCGERKVYLEVTRGWLSRPEQSYRFQRLRFYSHLEVMPLRRSYITVNPTNGEARVVKRNRLCEGNNERLSFHGKRLLPRRVPPYIGVYFSRLLYNRYMSPLTCPPKPYVHRPRTPRRRRRLLDHRSWSRL